MSLSKTEVIDLSTLLFNLYSNNIEKEISNIYIQLKRSNYNSTLDKNNYIRYTNRVKQLLNTVKYHLKSDDFSEFTYSNSFEKIQFKNKTDKFYSYPNKYSAYEDLLFYKGRLEVLKNRLESINNPYFKWQ